MVNVFNKLYFLSNNSGNAMCQQKQTLIKHAEKRYTEVKSETSGLS